MWQTMRSERKNVTEEFLQKLRGAWGNALVGTSTEAFTNSSALLEHNSGPLIPI